MGFLFNGKTYNVPGVYGIQKVVQQNGAIFPSFNVGLIIAKSMKGVPYSAGLKGSEMMLLYDDATSVARDYGHDDLYDMFRQAQKGGASSVFLLNAQPNTEASAIFDDSASSDSIKAKASPKNYGVFGNDIAIGILDSNSEVLATTLNWTGFTGAATGTATSGSSTTIGLVGAGWPVGTQLAGLFVVITGGLGIGQARRIVGSTAPNITVDTAWTTNPDTTSTFKIVVPKWQFTIIPTKNEKMITQNVSSGQNFIYLNNTFGISSGTILGLMSNAGFIAYYEVSSVDTTFTSSANGYKVVLKTAIASADATLANYARVEQYDTDNQYVITFEHADYNIDNIVPELNAQQTEIIFEKASGATLPPTRTSGNVFLGQAAGAVKGTNPAILSNDYAVIADNFPNWSDEFLKTNKVNIRHITLGTGDSANHAIFKSLSTTMKGDKYKRPLQIWTGQPLDETATSLIARAKALNSDSVIVCGGGLDGKPSYLSLAPQVFGNVVYNNVNHNLTRDLIDATVVEHEWTRTEIEQLTVGSVMIVDATKTGYRIVQGINSYQSHENEWNEQDNQSYLIQQRQVADFWFIGIMETLDALTIGVDGMDKDKIMAICNATGTRYRDEGIITSFRVVDIKKVGLGHTVRTDILIPGLNDFIGVINNIIAGESTLAA